MSELRQSQPPPAPRQWSPPQATPRTGQPSAAVDAKLQEVLAKWNRVISANPEENVLLGAAIRMGELKLRMCSSGANEAEAFDSVCRTYDSLLLELGIDDLAQENPELYSQLVVANKHLIGTYGHTPLPPDMPRSVVDERPPTVAAAVPVIAKPPTVANPLIGGPDFARRPAANAHGSSF